MKTCGIDNMENITNDIVSAFIDNLYINDCDRLMELRHFAEEKHVPIIQKSTEKLILGMLRIRKPKRILEIGTAVGYSACCFVHGCGCEVVTIENDPEAYEAAKSNIAGLGFEDKVKIIYGDARDVLEKLSQEAYNGTGEFLQPDPEKLFDAVFIDAAKSYYKDFWDLSVPLCNSEALIICDNVLMNGMTASDEYDPRKKHRTSIRKMREFINYIMNLNYAQSCIYPVGDGVALSIIAAPEKIAAVNELLLKTTE